MLVYDVTMMNAGTEMSGPHAVGLSWRKALRVADDIVNGRWARSRQPFDAEIRQRCKCPCGTGSRVVARMERL